MSSADVLVVHAAENDYRAFDSVCPHERNAIRQVLPTGGTYELRCPSHGWTFDLNGDPTGRPTARHHSVRRRAGGPDASNHHLLSPPCFAPFRSPSSS